MRKNKAEDIVLSDFKLYKKATVIKTVWHQHKSRRTEEWKREPRNKPSRKIDSSTAQERMRSGERTVSPVHVLGKLGRLVKKSEAGLLSEDLNVRPETMKGNLVVAISCWHRSWV